MSSLWKMPSAFPVKRTICSRTVVLFCRSLFVLLSFFFWPLCCLLFFDIRILITPLFDLVLSVLLRYTDSDYLPSIYGFWLPLCLTIVLSVLLRYTILITSLRYTDSDYLPSIYGFWLPPFDIRILITPLVSSYSSHFYCMETFLIIPIHVFPSLPNS